MRAATSPLRSAGRHADSSGQAEKEAKRIENVRQLKKSAELLDLASHQLRVFHCMFDEDDSSPRVKATDYLRVAKAIRDTLADVTDALFLSGSDNAEWRFASSRLGRIYNAFDACALAIEVMSSTSRLRGVDGRGELITSSPVVGTMQVVRELVERTQADVDRFLSRTKAPKLALVESKTA